MMATCLSWGLLERFIRKRNILIWSHQSERGGHLRVLIPFGSVWIYLDRGPFGFKAWNRSQHICLLDLLVCGSEFMASWLSLPNFQQIHCVWNLIGMDGCSSKDPTVNSASDPGRAVVWSCTFFSRTTWFPKKDVYGSLRNPFTCLWLCWSVVEDWVCSKEISRIVKRALLSILEMSHLHQTNFGCSFLKGARRSHWDGSWGQTVAFAFHSTTLTSTFSTLLSTGLEIDGW